jgi:hypothetical protein
MFGERESSLIVLALCLAAAPAHAQTAPVMTLDDYRSSAEVTVGVSIEGPPDVNQRPACQQLGLPCLTGRTMPDGGLAIGATVYPSEVFGIAGELSVYANAWSSWGGCPPRSGSTPPCPVSETNHVGSALAGVRVRTRLINYRGGPSRLFAQLLVGPQWSDVGPLRQVIQPGVGFNEYLRNGVAVHFEYDYRFAPDEKRDLSTSRFFLGIALPVGSQYERARGPLRPF